MIAEETAMRTQFLFWSSFSREELHEGDGRGVESWLCDQRRYPLEGVLGEVKDILKSINEAVTLRSCFSEHWRLTLLADYAKLEEGSRSTPKIHWFLGYYRAWRCGKATEGRASDRRIICRITDLVSRQLSRSRPLRRQRRSTIKTKAKTKRNSKLLISK